MRRRLPIENLRLPEFHLYKLETDHFETIKKCAKNKQLTMDLAMYHHAYSEKERYFNQTVRLVVAQRSGQNDIAFFRQIKTDLDSVENKIRKSSNDSEVGQLKNTIREKYVQYISDALQLDTLYNRNDPHPVFRAKAADRYSAAAYMCILLNDSGKAVEYAKKAIETDPSKTWPYSNLALALLLDGQVPKARHLYEQWASRDWRSSGYPGNLGTDSIFLHVFCGDKAYMEKLLAPEYNGQFKHLRECVRLLSEILPCVQKNQTHIAESYSITTKNPVTLHLVNKKIVSTEDDVKNKNNMSPGSSSDPAPQPVGALPPLNHRVYAVVSGSFQKKEGADNQLKTVQLAGYKKAYVQQTGGYFVVVVRDNLTWEEMKKVKKEVRDLGIAAAHLYKTVESR
jgi:tetratricopeptide (TPR) repeat protein